MKAFKNGLSPILLWNRHIFETENEYLKQTKGTEIIKTRKNTVTVPEKTKQTVQEAKPICSQLIDWRLIYF